MPVVFDCLLCNFKYVKCCHLHYKHLCAERGEKMQSKELATVEWTRQFYAFEGNEPHKRLQHASLYTHTFRVACTYDLSVAALPAQFDFLVWIGCVSDCSLCSCYLPFFVVLILSYPVTALSNRSSVVAITSVCVFVCGDLRPYTVPFRPKTRAIINSADEEKPNQNEHFLFHGAAVDGWTKWWLLSPFNVLSLWSTASQRIEHALNEHAFIRKRIQWLWIWIFHSIVEAKMAEQNNNKQLLRSETKIDPRDKTAPKYDGNGIFAFCGEWVVHGHMDFCVCAWRHRSSINGVLWFRVVHSKCKKK